MNYRKWRIIAALCLLTVGCGRAETSDLRPAVQHSVVSGEQLAALVVKQINGHVSADKKQLQQQVSSALATIASERHASEGAFNDAVDILIAHYHLAGADQ